MNSCAGATELTVSAKNGEASKKVSDKQILNDADDPDSKSSCLDVCRNECWNIMTAREWWANWFGFLLAIECAVAAYLYHGDPDRDEDDLYKFHPWSSDPTASLNATNALGLFGTTFLGIFGCIVLFEVVTNYHQIHVAKDKVLPCSALWTKIAHHFLGYTIFYLIAIFCLWLDKQRDLAATGVGYSIVSIFFGMGMTNLFIFGTGSEDNPWSWATKYSTKSCEFYIKVGLVLLATDLELIYSQGAPGLLVSWFIPPWVMIFMWFLGVRFLKIENHKFVICIAAGAAVCGTTAIAAVTPVVGLGEEDSAIAMSMLTFFTIFYMIALPYICLGLNLENEVCGAWIGGSVDETGKVAASLAIYDNQDATDTGIIIKVSQNILIAFICLALAVILGTPSTSESTYCSVSTEAGGGTNSDEVRRKEPQNKCAFLWKKFPKFVIGYLLLSVIVSLVVYNVGGESFGDRFLNNIGQKSKFLFTLGFVGIGAKTKFTTLWQAIKDGKYLKLYLIGQTFDTVITLIAAFIVYTYIV